MRQISRSKRPVPEARSEERELSDALVRHETQDAVRIEAATSMMFSAPCDSAEIRYKPLPCDRGAACRSRSSGRNAQDVREAIHRHRDQIAMTEDLRRPVVPDVAEDSVLLFMIPPRAGRALRRQEAATPGEKATSKYKSRDTMPPMSTSSGRRTAASQCDSFQG